MQIIEFFERVGAMSDEAQAAMIGMTIIGFLLFLTVLSAVYSIVEKWIDMKWSNKK